MRGSQGPRTVGLDQVFHAREIDANPDLLNDSYRLRYQVYCLERGFLRPDDYPDQMERDEFDRVALHVGVVDQEQALVATARLVKVGLAGLPLFRHCRIDAYEDELYCETNRVAEVSRLCTSRCASGRQSTRKSVALGLYRAIYQASKRHDITHWVAAMEPSLQRRLGSIGVPFKTAGPITDYCGPVAPYVLDMQEFDMVIMSRTRPALHDFLEGLEARFSPITYATAV